MPIEPQQVRLTNKNGLELLISSLGASVLALKVPDRKGQLVNVVLGFSNASAYLSENYLNNCVYMGCTVGRYAGRISRGFFKIDGTKYNIYHDNGVSLHGGKEGFDKKNWEIDHIENGDSSKVTLSYLSRDMEEGYPGNLKVTATYELTQNNKFIITYFAETDKTTHVNITNHNYYNLDGAGDILKHDLKLNCPKYVETDAHLLPSGELRAVTNKYDYLEERTIGDNGFSGLDDTFIFGDNEEKAVLSSMKSGIKMSIATNQPSVVIFTPSNFNTFVFNDGASFNDYPAICFETQKLPDTPNNEHFPSTLLRPGEIYENRTVLTFTNI